MTMKLYPLALICVCLLCACSSPNVHYESQATGALLSDGTRLMLLKTVNPEYPAELRKARITGVVVISYCVRPDGSVTDLEVKKSAHPALDRLALEAVSQWKFTPYSPRDGQLVHLSNPIAFAID